MLPTAKIKSLLPASSRSFHAAENRFDKQTEEIKKQLQDIRAQQDRLYARIEQTDCGVNENLNFKFDSVMLPKMDDLSNDLNAHDEHMKMFAWEAYRHRDESIEDAKKRFFRTLPQATGGMRLLQLGCAKLLHDFDFLCREHDISYWINFGTLLGAVRHGGFIPWDDDMDLGITRDELDRLMRIVANDDRFRITTVFDRYVHCRQVRFLYSDQMLPCFLDLFIYDWTSGLDSNVFAEQRKLRETAISKMDNDPRLSSWPENPLLPFDDPVSATIDRYFKEALNESTQHGYICEKGEASAVLWSLDNLDDGKQRWWAYDLRDIFPLKRIVFEGVECYAPSNPDSFLTSRYGDYLSLPKDIHTHFQHVDHDELETPETKEALKRAIG